MELITRQQSVCVCAITRFVISSLCHYGKTTPPPRQASSTTTTPLAIFERLFTPYLLGVNMHWALLKIAYGWRRNGPRSLGQLAAVIGLIAAQALDTLCLVCFDTKPL